MKYLEKIGNLVLLLVFVAIIRMPYFEMFSLDYKILIITMSICTGILCISSLFRNFFNIFSKKFLVVLGFILLVQGIIVFYFFTGYFYHTLQLPIPFWYVVSLYSLPAICVEGAIMTHFIMFQDFIEKEKIKKLFTLLFILYAGFAIGTNFLVLFKIIHVWDHVLFSRVISIFTLLISSIIVSDQYVKKKYKQKTHVSKSRQE